MNIDNLRLHEGNDYFFQPAPRHGTDKIAGLFSTASIAFSFVKHLATSNASIIIVNENHTTTAKTIGKPAFEIANSLEASLINLVQNNRLNSFVREKIFKNFFGCQLLVRYSTEVGLHSCILYPWAANNVLASKIKARSRAFTRYS